MQMQSNGLPFSKMGKTRLHHAGCTISCERVVVGGGFHTKKLRAPTHHTLSTKVSADNVFNDVSQTDFMSSI